MANVEFFKQQAKNLFKDYNTKFWEEDEGYYTYIPRFFYDLKNIIDQFEIDEENDVFTLMKAQHIIARFAGFYKWNELIKASEPILEIGKLLLLNREDYPRKLGLHRSMGSLLVEEWKAFESSHLIGYTDEQKLEAFKSAFLNDYVSQADKDHIVRLDLSGDDKAQDMVRTVMKHKNLPPDKAILSVINPQNCDAVLATGWADQAVHWWGHFDPHYRFTKLENPQIEIKISASKAFLIGLVMRNDMVCFKNAILHFMIFELEEFGYHI